MEAEANGELPPGATGGEREYRQKSLSLQKVIFTKVIRWGEGM